MLRRGKGLILIVTMQMFLVGCGLIGTRVSGNYDLKSQQVKGLVVFSARVVESCEGLSNLNAHIFREDQSGIAVGFTAKNFILSPHIPGGGYFYVYEFDAGNYTIGLVEATGFTLIASSTQKKDWLTFSVHPQQVRYLGELEFSLAGGCGIVKASVNDRWDRDAKLFEERMPNISVSTVMKQLMTFSPQ